ncbi:hypothetical protein CXK96_17930 [Stutzerimonas stutzeri]|nr:hypothetical protein CXK96_17930 [Stutzerimonas stutzeri]
MSIQCGRCRRWFCHPSWCRHERHPSCRHECHPSCRHECRFSLHCFSNRRRPCRAWRRYQ